MRYDDMCGTPTLFDDPMNLPAVGPGEPGAAWWVWSPSLGFLMHIEPDVAAKYQQQGCFVILAEEGVDGIGFRPSGEDLSQRPEPEPDLPPFGDEEIVWYYRAADFAPESYYEQWERIADWLRVARPELRPEDHAEEMSRRLGRWAGKYDLEATQ